MYGSDHDEDTFDGVSPRCSTITTRTIFSRILRQSLRYDPPSTRSCSAATQRITHVFHDLPPVWIGAVVI